ncbi:filamentous hemagglutinin N-terminal domain-containing protein [Anabaena cylindrica FACHB-243]|uniref:Filamentous hemagglutinin family outer membrane protein n=1 Tax=Anabaena cylindrica (strain ATCC 27899 / PCC 7122) TaxID=272123 RepID=K9ZFT2_ANACC|nr:MULTISPECIES: filamentous hemagglutinin N-terminal domain-containing protein [Anabaena]AFZ57447.1 filamentous hemagglutinin family outer membrane protein [Anabaena cylindrica PCC 7122]MBD2421128.1 filamentous hemagglutinin N-terminal domain-containing protein [Anabaena cylindrica FACHB-243]MBY5284084.1 filamentous hemagglutinin N-terminal domain-containing protein [Anabaena sp. CCAP 1446/1C]MBY5310654.1 filamentous hemagglutinin N-terminal domain-containing protein [Anabaena sp. CCAP 1446/1C
MFEFIKILTSKSPLPYNKKGWIVPAVLCFLTLTCLSTQKTSAQLTPDTSLATENSVITPTLHINGMNIDRIDGGAARGTNLFHSFQEFNVEQERGVYFSQPAGIARIITRVTGSNSSQILGTLGVLGNADLFMINPNGIIFGQNARLDIKGSFVGSTANSINFDHGIQFNATHPDAKPLLSVNVPQGLQFGTSSGSITNLSKPGLTINSGNTFALVGGDITFEGSAANIEGRIELGSVSHNSFVSLNPLTLGWELGYQEVQNFKDIHLTQGSAIRARYNQNSTSNGQTVNVAVIQGRNLTISDGSFISARNVNPLNTPNLFVKTSDSIKLIGVRASNNLGSGLYNQTVSANNAGNIILETQRLIIQDGGVISTTTTGNGRAGDITINTSESIEVIGSNPDPRNGAGIFSNASAGNGIGGNLTINTKRLIIQGGGAITTYTSTSGKAGDLSITAKESIELIGDNKITGLFANSVAENNPGIGGNLDVNTKELSVIDGATITVSNLFGQAGNLTVTADKLFLNQGKLTANTSASKSGEGANITLSLQNLLLMRNQSLISAQASGLANGGNITIDAKDGFVVALSSENSDIIANADKGNGGNINITTQGIFGIDFNLQNTEFSDITASSQFGLNGQVTINTLNIDPSQGLVTLSTNVLDTANQVDQRCVTSRKFALQKNQFTITGKGGFPTSPSDLFTGTTALVDLVDLVPSQSNNRDIQPVDVSIIPQKEILEAQGWVIDDQGQVHLVAKAVNTLSISPILPAISCSQS